MKEMSHRQLLSHSEETRAEIRARKGAGRKEDQEASAGLSVSATADLPEALQPPARRATTSQVTKSAYRSLNKVRQATKDVIKPMQVVETESEALQVESPGQAKC